MKYFFDARPYLANLGVVILDGDDAAVAGGGVVLDGGHVERLDGEGVHHADVDSLTVTQ